MRLFLIPILGIVFLLLCWLTATHRQGLPSTNRIVSTREKGRAGLCLGAQEAEDAGARHVLKAEKALPEGEVFEEVKSAGSLTAFDCLVRIHAELEETQSYLDRERWEVAIERLSRLSYELIGLGSRPYEEGLNLRLYPHLHMGTLLHTIQLRLIEAQLGLLDARRKAPWNERALNAVRATLLSDKADVEEYVRPKSIEEISKPNRHLWDAPPMGTLRKQLWGRLTNDKLKMRFQHAPLGVVSKYLEEVAGVNIVLANTTYRHIAVSVDLPSTRLDKVLLHIAESAGLNCTVGPLGIIKFYSGAR